MNLLKNFFDHRKISEKFAYKRSAADHDDECEAVGPAVKQAKLDENEAY